MRVAGNSAPAAGRPDPPRARVRTLRGMGGSSGVSNFRRTPAAPGGADGHTAQGDVTDWWGDGCPGVPEEFPQGTRSRFLPYRPTPIPRSNFLKKHARGHFRTTK